MTWNDLELDENEKTLMINKTAQYIAKKGIIIKEPKTPNSIREIVLSNGLVDTLKKWKIEQENEKQQYGNDWKYGNRVFTFHPDTISKWFVKFMKRNKLGNGNIGLHKLRAANIMLQLYMRN